MQDGTWASLECNCKDVLYNALGSEFFYIRMAESLVHWHDLWDRHSERSVLYSNINKHALVFLEQMLSQLGLSRQGTH